MILRNMNRQTVFADTSFNGFMGTPGSWFPMNYFVTWSTQNVSCSFAWRMVGATGAGSVSTSFDPLSWLLGTTSVAVFLVVTCLGRHCSFLENGSRMLPDILANTLNWWRTTSGCLSCLPTGIIGLVDNRSMVHHSYSGVRTSSSGLTNPKSKASRVWLAWPKCLCMFLFLVGVNSTTRPLSFTYNLSSLITVRDAGGMSSLVKLVCC